MPVPLSVYATAQPRLRPHSPAEIAPFYPQLGKSWSGGTPLPGGDLGGQGFAAFVADLRRQHPQLDADWLARLARRHGSAVAEIYGSQTIHERHRHRYEVNINYKDRLEKVGLRFSGMSPDGILPEIVEIPDHPWFIGVQYHPELKSRLFEPHPLFVSFIRAAVTQARLV